MKIIALNGSHDSSITALEDGKILFHWELERVLNEKHFCVVDKGDEITGVLLEHCLPRLGWKLGDISAIVFAGKTEWGKTSFAGQVPQYRNEETEKPWAEGEVTLKGVKIKAYSVLHHVCHLACAYFTSPFNKSLIWSYDGIGNGTSTMVGLGKDNHVEVKYNFIDKLPANISRNGIGLAFSHTKDIFPFLNKGAHPLLSAAGKIMGMSNYAEPKQEWIDEVYKTITTWMPDMQGLPARLGINPANLADTKHPATLALAATLQEASEMYVTDAVKKLTQEFSTENLCMVGGCALNVLINSKVSKLVKNLYIPAATSDCGIGLGAALYVWHHVLNNKFEPIKSFSPYLGDELYHAPDDSEPFKTFMKDSFPELKYSKFDKFGDLSLNAATNLYNGKIIAWAQGRGEIGPRALLNRSIISNCKQGKKEEINDKIKHREYWRPFASCVLAEDYQTYFDIDHESPYMLEAPQVNKFFAEFFPAVVHVDGTSRIQTISRTNNAAAHQLLKDYKMLAGTSVLLNTSLNDHGKPISNDLGDILNLLCDTELDIAYVGNYKFEKISK